jgi:TonB family protein
VLGFCLLSSSVQAQPVVHPPSIQLDPKEAKKLVRTRVIPRYPADAKQNRIQGTVILLVIVNERGLVDLANAVRGPAELRRVSEIAVRQWTFEPFVLNGQPTPFTTNIDIPFEIR